MGKQCRPRSDCTSEQSDQILHCMLYYLLLLKTYRNDPKFSDRYVKANSAEPDQTAPRGAV